MNKEHRRTHHHPLLVHHSEHSQWTQQRNEQQEQQEQVQDGKDDDVLSFSIILNIHRESNGRNYTLQDDQSNCSP